MSHEPTNMLTCPTKSVIYLNVFSSYFSSYQPQRIRQLIGNTVTNNKVCTKRNSNILEIDRRIFKSMLSNVVATRLKFKLIIIIYNKKFSSSVLVATF